MKSFRKQFEGTWKVVTLSDKEVVIVENQAFAYIKRIQEGLAETGLSHTSALPSFLSVYESFASDLIEAKWKAFQEAKKAKADAEKAPAQ